VDPIIVAFRRFESIIAGPGDSSSREPRLIRENISKPELHEAISSTKYDIKHKRPEVDEGEFQASSLLPPDYTSFRSIVTIHD
jgi:hypothetical protein